MVAVVAVGLVGELPHPNATAAPAAAPIAPISSRRLIFLLGSSISSCVRLQSFTGSAGVLDDSRWQRRLRVNHVVVAAVWQLCAKSVISATDKHATEYTDSTDHTDSADHGPRLTRITRIARG